MLNKSETGIYSGFEPCKKSTPLFTTRSDSAVLNQSAPQQRHHLVNAQSHIDSSRANLSRCEATMANLEESQETIAKARVCLVGLLSNRTILFFRVSITKQLVNLGKLTFNVKLVSNKKHLSFLRGQDNYIFKIVLLDRLGFTLKSHL